MNRTRLALLYTVAFLICASVQGYAAGPGPVARIDLPPLGYKPSSKETNNRTSVKWWRQYVVIDSTYIICGRCGPDSTYTYTPGPRLVIDSTTGKQVPAETVADAALEANPQDFQLKNEHPQTPDGELLARWRGMTLIRDKEHKVWLLEPGQEKKLISAARVIFHSATFVSPDRILIIAEVPDKPSCNFCQSHLWVVDKSGELKYKLPAPLNVGVFDYYAVNRAGTRFVVRDNIESGRETALDVMTLGIASAFPFNTGKVTVYAANDGQKLFEYKWRLGKYEHDSYGCVALSNDGSLLAVIQDTCLLIFQLPQFPPPGSAP